MTQMKLPPENPGRFKPQRSAFIAGLGGVAFEDLAFLVDRAPGR